MKGVGISCIGESALSVGVVGGVGGSADGAVMLIAGGCADGVKWSGLDMLSDKLASRY